MGLRCDHNGKRSMVDCVGDLGEVGISLLNKDLCGLPEIADLHDLSVELVRESGVFVLDSVIRIGDLDILSVGSGEVVSEGVVDLVKVLDLGLVGIQRNDGVVELDTGGIELGVQFSNGSIQSVDL